MPPVQLSRLRPQVNALMAHYQDQEYFRNTLLLIFEKYSEKKNTANAWLRANLSMPSYHVPLIVMNELESALHILARAHPQESVILADMLWEQTYYEPKKLAIFLLAKLEAPYQEEFITHIQNWISEGLDENLISEIIEQSSQKSDIITSGKWANLVRSWINSGQKDMQKVGIRAVSVLVEEHDFQDMPLIFELISPLYSQPRIAIQKSVMDLTRKLIERSQPETASFFISLAEVNQKESIFALIRKSLPLFDEFYQAEIRKSVMN